MADAKHTPGPWAQSRLSPLTITAASGQVVADVGHPRDFHVLLAAPDLLEALQAIFAAMHPDIPGAPGSALEKARAAIAKATGSAS